MNNTVDLNNLPIAFGYKRNSELRFTYYVFKMLKSPFLVGILSQFANGILKYHIPLKPLIRNTVFRIFCSGEDISEAFSTIDKLRKFKVGSVLDYVAEGEKTEQAFAANTLVITENINRLGQEAPGNAVSVKFTSLEEVDFYKQSNAAVVEGRAMSGARYENLLRRINTICNAAFQNKVVIYFDAEDRNMQDFFDRLVEMMMERYNTKEAIIYNTLQMYLTDRLSYLRYLLADAMSKKYYPGIKLVRGAYAEKERETAALEKKVSPIYPTKRQTDLAFNEALDLCLKNHERVYTCIASHNEYSTRFALDCINRYGITDHYKKVKFSQLYGMRDNLTFNLGARGYNSSKYLPYGEVKKAIPYLIRRAEENSSIVPQLMEELARLKNEIKRRKLIKK